jgi:glycosyltransferase involved in cell wall biosynthesis
MHRVVACRSATSTTLLFTNRGLADVLIELPPSSKHRVSDRIRVLLVLTRSAWRMRGNLAAIHANGLSEFNLVVLPALVARCRIVVWVHEWQVSGWSRRLTPLLRLLAYNALFAVVSEQSRQMLVDARLARPSRISVVPNPIDPDDVCAQSTPSSPDGLRVSFVGTPARYKGFDLLPSLVRATADLKVAWTVFAGPESAMSAVFDELRGLGVNLPGKVLDVKEIYGACDAVVVPSREESFGRVAAEAMANGIPVVASDLPQLRNILGDNQAGLLVPSGDITAFGAAIGRLAKDPALRVDLGRRGKQRSRRFAPSVVTDALTCLYGIAHSAALS